MASIRLPCLILCVLSLVNGSKWQESDPGREASSISDAVRMGATMVSRFLNPHFRHSLFSLFKKLTDETKVSQEELKDEGNEIILLVLRLMGVSNEKVTDFAFDGVISLVHLMNRILIENGGRRRKEKAEFSLFRFILRQPQVSHLLKQMQDPELVDLILKELEEKLRNYPDEGTDCIKGLVCRTKPFVQGMQRSLRFFMNRENIKIPSGKETRDGKTDEETCPKRNEDASWEKANLEDRMYFFVPSLKEVFEFGNECDQLFSNCVY